MNDPKSPMSAAATTAHDHDHCIDDAMARAEALCAKRGSRFTDLRRNVLQLIWADHKAVKAYDLIDRLSEKENSSVKPPTVYRALDFLMEHGLVHKVESLNAYIGCPHPDESHLSQFLICDACEDVQELSVPGASEALLGAAQAKDFSVKKQTVEVHGVCGKCSG